MRATGRSYSAFIHPYPHFPFSPVCPAEPRNKGQRPGLTFYRRVVVLPQGISVLRLTPDPFRLYQHLVRENAFAFKYPKRAVLDMLYLLYAYLSQLYLQAVSLMAVYLPPAVLT